MPRLKKPIRELKLSGQYRKDRHGGRAEVTLTPGHPSRPRWVSSREGRDLWERIAPPLYEAKLACLEDTHALASLCDWWGIYRSASRKAQKAESADAARKFTLSASTAWRNCAELFKRFGLTPQDRANLKVEGANEGPTKAQLRYFG